MIDNVPWWEREPGRLEYELQALRLAGIGFKEDPQAREKGIIALDIDIEDPRADQKPNRLKLRATFPDLYPDFRPMVDAPNMQHLPRHQHPFGGNLCLLDRPTEAWERGFTLEWLLTVQLPRTLHAGNPDTPLDVVRALEAPQGEPESDYFSSISGSMLVIDSDWALGEATHGSFESMVTFGTATDARGHALPVVRGMISEVRSSDRTTLARIERTPPIYATRMWGSWVRVERPPFVSPDKFRSSVAAISQILPKPNWQKVPDSTYEVDLLAVVFPEEVEQGRRADGWVVNVQVRQKKNQNPAGHAFINTVRGGIASQRQRVPAVASLSDKTVAIVGLGAIGAPVALGLARNNIGCLRLLDNDISEPGPSPRWPLGAESWGIAKVQALAERICRDYPDVDVKPIETLIGRPRHQGDGRVPDERLLADLADGADVLLDATAERRVTEVLSKIARQKNIPFVTAYATLGAWGGLVARILPDADCCWNCLQYALADGSIKSPPHDPGGEIQPVGCGDRSFTGAGFDLESVSLEVLRTITRTLSGNHGYPEQNWDIAVLSLRNPDGSSIPPSWKGDLLVRHATCPHHPQE